ncbi:MAG TPA: hypothetical protein VFM95_09920 [Microcella sp.]|nr:hypothetical protein [Microcella sp.]
MADTRRTPLVTTLIVLMVCETVFVVGFTVILTLQFAAQSAEFPVTAVAFLICAVLVGIWMAATVIGLVRARAWTRGSVLTYHFLQLAVGVGSLQGFVPRPDIASWIIIPSVAGIVLILTPTLVDYLRERD